MTRPRVNPVLLLAIAASWSVLIECDTNTPSKGSLSHKATAISPDPSAHLDILCVGDRITNPPENFHYSYKYSDAAGSVDHEADITPQAIDIQSTEKSGKHAYHGVRSDEASWNAAVLNLSSLKLTSMSARLDSLNGTSAIRSQGTESVNGYATTKYAIDTTRASVADQQQYATLFGKGSSEKGTLWTPADGCAVKLILDDSIAQQDGTIRRAHYEIARIKP